jgi:hypothetical protein
MPHKIGYVACFIFQKREPCESSSTQKLSFLERRKLSDTQNEHSKISTDQQFSIEAINSPENQRS